MSCREIRNRLVAYADDELGVEAALETEEHLERCAACRAAFVRQRDFRRAVGALYPRRRVPEELSRQVRREIRPRPAWRRTAALGAAIAASIVAVAAVRALHASRAAAVPAEIAAALRLHEAAERGQAPLGLASTSQTQVNRWLARELPFVAPIPGSEGGEFRLAGASSVRLGEDRAGYVLYHLGAEPISLFMLPPRPWPAIGREIVHRGVEFRAIEVGSHRIIAWNHEPVSYLLVSRLDRPPGEACAVCHLGREAPAIAGFGAARGS